MTECTIEYLSDNKCINCPKTIGCHNLYMKKMIKQKKTGKPQEKSYQKCLACKWFKPCSYCPTDLKEACSYRDNAGSCRKNKKKPCLLKYQAETYVVCDDFTGKW